MAANKRKSKPQTKRKAKSKPRAARAATPVPEVPMESLRQHLVYLLSGGGAHVHFEQAMADWPPNLRGIRPNGFPHTAWRLLEHMRIAQRDILEFSRNASWVSPEWPDGYWPAQDAPPTMADWEKSIRSFKADLEVLEKLVADPGTDLFTKIPHGEGQTILREVLLAADHNAYHLGELVTLRRMLGAWKR